MKFIVQQTFETLGDPCRSNHRTRSGAERAAAKLERSIARMVAEWETPDSEQFPSSAYIHETEAWEHALMLAGGANTYGAEAGQYIASAAVEIEEA